MRIKYIFLPIFIFSGFSGHAMEEIGEPDKAELVKFIQEEYKSETHNYIKNRRVESSGQSYKPQGKVVVVSRISKRCLELMEKDFRSALKKVVVSSLIILGPMAIAVFCASQGGEPGGYFLNSTLNGTMT